MQTRRRTTGRRYPILIAVVGLLGLLATLMLAGCGGSSDTTADASGAKADAANSPVEATTDPAREATPASDQEEAAEDDSAAEPLRYVGTITKSYEGTTFSNQLKVGPILYSDEATPPEAVLSACAVNNQAIVASSVFARGTLTASYTEGTLPLAFEVPTFEYVEGELFAPLAMKVGGAWTCFNQGQAYLEFQPGESQTFPIWIVMAGALTNAHPRLPQSLRDSLYINFIGPLGPIRETVSGPGRTTCYDSWSGEEERLYLFTTSGDCE